jgi:hypothetical protein
MKNASMRDIVDGKFVVVAAAVVIAHGELARPE